MIRSLALLASSLVRIAPGWCAGLGVAFVLVSTPWAATVTAAAQQEELIPASGGPDFGEFEELLKTRAEVVTVAKGDRLGIVHAILGSWNVGSITTMNMPDVPRDLTYRDVTLEEFLDAVCLEYDGVSWSYKADCLNIFRGVRRADAYGRTYEVSAIVSRLTPPPTTAEDRTSVADQLMSLVVGLELCGLDARSVKVSHDPGRGPLVEVQAPRRDHLVFHDFLRALAAPEEARRRDWAESRDWNDFILATLDERVEVLARELKIDEVLQQISGELSLPIVAPELGWFEKRRKVTLISSEKTLREIIAELFPAGNRRAFATQRGLIVKRRAPVLTRVYDLKGVARAFPKGGEGDDALAALLASDPWKAAVNAGGDTCASKAFLDSVVVRAPLEFHHELQSRIEDS